MALLKKKLSAMLSLQNEKQRRALIAAEVDAWGRGGGSLLAHITGMSRKIIRRGRRGLKRPRSRALDIRQPGGGRGIIVVFYGSEADRNRWKRGRG